MTAGGIGTLDYAGARTPKRRVRRGILGWMLFIGLAIMLIALFQVRGRPYTTISFSQLTLQLNKGNVRSVTLSDTEIDGELLKYSIIGGTVVQYFRCPLPTGLSNNLSFIDRLTAAGAEVRFENDQNVLLNLFVPFIPWLLIFAFLWFFVFRRLRNARVIQAPLAATAPSAQSGEVRA